MKTIFSGAATKISSGDIPNSMPSAALIEPLMVGTSPRSLSGLRPQSFQLLGKKGKQGSPKKQRRAARIRVFDDKPPARKERAAAPARICLALSTSCSGLMGNLLWAMVFLRVSTQFGTGTLAGEGERISLFLFRPFLFF